MIIRNLELDHGANGSSMSASVCWEDGGQGTHHLWFEFPEPARQFDEPCAEAFLLACFPLAAIHGERRLAIDAPLCPMLIEGLQSAHAWWRLWGGMPSQTVAIEGRTRTASRSSGAPRRAVAMVSGGVDSLDMVLRNRRRFAEHDAAYLREAVLVHGYDIGKRARNSEEPRYRKAFGLLAPALAELKIQLTECRTNLRHLPSRTGFWAHRHYGAALAAAGYAATVNPSFLFIASTNDIAHLTPIGSHPAVDVQYSSQRVTIVHDGARFLRLEKLREIISWPRGLAALRVCPANIGDLQNCGRCEKCLRTRLELLVLGVVHTDALGPSLTPFELWDAPTVRISYAVQAVGYRYLLPPLRGLGYESLCEIIERKLQDYENRKNDETEWVGG